MKTKRILVPLITGFEETEYIAVRDVLIREGFDVESVSLTGERLIMANHNTKIMADLLYKNIKNALYDYEILFIPGGMGVKNLDKSLEFENILNEFYSNNKIIGAICAAPTLLASRRMLDNKKAVVFPDKKNIKILEKNNVLYQGSELDYVSDDNIFTGKNMQASIKFGYAFSEYIKEYKEA